MPVIGGDPEPMQCLLGMGAAPQGEFMSLTALPVRAACLSMSCGGMERIWYP